MCVFVDWACTFFHGRDDDSLSSLYGNVRISIFYAKWLVMAPGPLIVAIPTTD
jgi:hypothetical protein